MSAKIVVTSSQTWVSGWMRRSRRRLAQWQRDVDGFRGEPRIERRLLQQVAPRRQRLRHRILGEVDRGALRLALLRRHLSKGRKQGGDRALLAEGSDAHRLEGGFVAAAAIWSRMDFSSVARSDTVNPLVPNLAGLSPPEGRNVKQKAGHFGG